MEIRNSIGLNIMKEELELAIKELKCNKVVGIDHLNRELLMTLEGTGKKVLSNITEAYETGEVLDDFEKCIMIPISKNANIIGQ
jgi:hypothetical protein